MKFPKSYHIFLILGALILLFAVIVLFQCPVFILAYTFGEGLLLIAAVCVLFLLIELLYCSYAKYMKRAPVDMPPDKVIRNYVLGLILLFPGLVFLGPWLWVIILRFVLRFGGWFPFYYLLPMSRIFFFDIGPILGLILAHISERLIWRNRGQPYFTAARISFLLVYLYILSRVIFHVLVVYIALF